MIKHFVGLGILAFVLSGGAAFAKPLELHKLQFECNYSTQDGVQPIAAGEQEVYHCGTMPDGAAVYTLNSNQPGRFCRVDYVTLADAADGRPVRAAGAFLSRPGENTVEVFALVLALGKISMLDRPENLVFVSAANIHAKLGMGMGLTGGAIQSSQGEGISCSVTLR